MVSTKVTRPYAKVSIEMWGDKRFNKLSGLQPSGKALWLYLLTGEFRTAIPGLNLKVGLGGLSDRLAWSYADVERCWQEIAALDMAAADWRAGVIWLPRGIEHNEPESPNVIRGWGKVVLPECDLTRRALQSLERYITQGLSEAFAKAFRQTFREGSANQEQEQEQEVPPNPPARAGGRRHRRPRLTEEQAKRLEEADAAVTAQIEHARRRVG